MYNDWGVSKSEIIITFNVINFNLVNIKINLLAKYLQKYYNVESMKITEL